MINILSIQGEQKKDTIFKQFDKQFVVGQKAKEKKKRGRELKGREIEERVEKQEATP